MKKIINSVLILLTLYLSNFADYYGVAAGVVIGLIFSLWGYLLISEIDFAIVFCVLGYLNVFRINFSETLQGSIASLSQIYLILLIATLIFVRGWRVPFGKNIKFVNIILLFFVYQTVISVIPNLILGTLSLDILLLNKDRYYGLLFFFPGYFVGIRNSKKVIDLLIYFTCFFFVIYFLSIFDIVPLLKIEEQNIMEGITRLRFELNQIFKLFIYFIPVLFFIKTRYKIYYLILGISGLMGLVLNVFRTEMLYVFLGIIYGFYLMKKHFPFSVKNISTNVGILVGIIMVAVSIISLSIFQNLYYAFIETQKLSINLYSFYHRFYEILPNHLVKWTENLWNILFGIGIVNALHENTLTPREIAIWDISISGVLMSYGLIGIAIYLNLYRFIIIRLKDFLVITRVCLSNFQNKDNHVIVFGLGLGIYFVTCIFFRTYYMFWELAFSNMLVEFGFFLGLFAGIVHISENNLLNR